MNVLWMVAALLTQDDTAKAKEVLEAAAAAMKEAPALRFDCESAWKGVEMKQKLTMTLRRPNLGRIELAMNEQQVLYVLDGKTYWSYMKNSNQYMKFPQSEGMLDWIGAGPVPSMYLEKSAAKVLDGAGGVSLKKEKLGEDECDVVAWKQGDEMESRLWVDAKKAIRKYVVTTGTGEQAFEQTVTFGKFDLDPKPADDAFTFTPPKDAKEMKEDEPGEDLLAVGTDAPEFEGTDLEDKAVKLSEYKGKTVLLNFWFYD